MTRRTPSQYNWEKVQFDETLVGTNRRTSPRANKIAFVVVHHMTIVGNGKGAANAKCLAVWKTREASAHYGVDGEYVNQFVLDGDAAWATANRTGNHSGISIEHANSTAGPKWLVSETTWKTGARLAAQLHIVYKLGRPVDKKTLRQHDEFYATACPGPFLGGTNWSNYVKETQRVYDLLKAGKPVTSTPSVPVPEVPTVYNKLDPASYFIGVKGSHVKWLVGRLVAHGYKVTGEEFTESIRKAVSSFQLKQWPGSSTAKGGDADGFPGTATLSRLSLDPEEVKPKPPVVPSSAIKVRTIDMNVAGYNDYGQKTYKKRTDAFGAKMLSLNPDIITLQELSNLSKAKMRPRLDAILKKGSIVRAAGGSDGRYVYYNTKTVKRIASGNYVASKTSWYKKDDKQAAWLVYEKSGRRAMEVSFHTENEAGADTKRVSQALSFLSQTLATAKKYKVNVNNISFNGDTNSDNLVRKTMEVQGWVASDRVATTTDNSKYKTHNGWATPARGDHIDYLFVRKGVKVSLWRQYPRKDWSDHHLIIVIRDIV